MPRTRLLRNLSLPVLTLYGLGNVLGAGIYVLIGKVAGVSGVATPIAFLLAGAIAALTSFSYMELSSRYPVSAGASVYVHQGFGRKRLAQLVGLLMIVSAILSSATLARGFAGYLNEFVPVPTTIAIIGLLVGLGAIVAAGITGTARLAALFTGLEIAGLLLIIWSGRAELVQPANYRGMLELGSGGVSAIFLGAFLAFYAFIGFEDMVNVAEEVKRPRRTMPAALLISLIISTVLYILVVIVAINALPVEELANSRAPLSLVFSKVAGADPWVITAIGISAAVNGILVHIVLISRVLYGMASRGWIHAELAVVHSTTRTPLVATLVAVVTTVVAALFLSIVTLAQLTSYSVLAVFGLVNTALIVIQRRGGRRPQVMVPRWVPLVGAISCVVLIAYQILAG